MRTHTILLLGVLSTAVACQRNEGATATLSAEHAGHDHDHHDHPEALASIPPPSGEPGVVDVYMSPTCGCCGKWVAHLRENGFTVNEHKVQDVVPVKVQSGLPPSLASCHSGIVDGYHVEGHVPAKVIRRLLAERPKIKGIAVPRMPEGSPGMEGPNPEPYSVYAYKDGMTTVYEHVAVD